MRLPARLHDVTRQSVVREFGLAVEERVTVEMNVAVVAEGDRVKELAGGSQRWQVSDANSKGGLKQILYSCVHVWLFRACVHAHVSMHLWLMNIQDYP